MTQGPRAKLAIVNPHRTRPRPGRALTGCLLTLTLAMAGCDPQPGYGMEDHGLVVYRHAMDGAPTSLDPAHASTIYANFLVVNLYDTLYRYRYLARPYELEPNLAESLPQVSADGLIYTIRIKPGVRFIDDPAFADGQGRVLRAEDIVYTIKRHFHPATRSQGSWLWRGKIVGLDEWAENGADYAAEVPGLRALDDRTIQIQLIAPYPQLTHTLAQGFSAIVPREAVERYGAELGVHAVGSGPFRLNRFDSTGASLLRNVLFRAEPFSLEVEGYDPATQQGFGLEELEGGIPPFADRIEVSFIAEDAARWNAFNAGEVHFVKAPVTQFDQLLASRRTGPRSPSAITCWRTSNRVSSTPTSTWTTRASATTRIRTRTRATTRCAAPSSRLSTGSDATTYSSRDSATCSLASSRR